MDKYNLNARVEPKSGRWNVYDGDQLLSNKLDPSEQESLAKIFAAAPDLLEACEEAQVLIAAFLSELPYLANVAAPVLQRLVKAQAKARGESEGENG